MLSELRTRRLSRGWISAIFSLAVPAALFSMSFNAPRAYPIGGNGLSWYATAVAVADLNGDGYPDAVVANYGVSGGTGTVTILLGNGHGELKAGKQFDAGSHPQSLVIADLNGDGKPDLAVSHGYDSSAFSGTVSVMLGNGDGTFQPPVSYAAGPNSYSLAVVISMGTVSRTLSWPVPQ